jgi:hypothetical protein
VDFTPGKIEPGRVAWAEVKRIESLARRKSSLITKEMIEKNIEPRPCSSSSPKSEQSEEPKLVSDYELWLVKKDFEAKIKKDLIEDLLLEYGLEQKKLQDNEKELQEERELA